MLAEDIAECLNDDRGRERLVVLQHLLGVFIAIHHEDGFAFLARYSRNLDALHRFLASQPGEFGVRVPHIAGHEIVELPEVLEIVE